MRAIDWLVLTRCLFLIAAICCSTVSARSEVAAVVFMASNGADSNSGRASSEAVATLGKAFEIVSALPAEVTAVTILVAPGAYQGRGTTWNVPRSFDKRVLLSANGGRVEFDGAGAEDWLIIRSPWGRSLDLTIDGFAIRNYVSAVAIFGDRDRREAWISGVVVRNNSFSRIGRFVAGSKQAFSALTVANGRNIIIENNVFSDVRSETDCTGMHAIYLAHFSSHNRIAHNSFKDVHCGFVVKTRDRSDSNVFEGNFFDTPGVTALYGDQLDRCQLNRSCTAARKECPSGGNRFVGNEYSQRVRDAHTIEVRTPQVSLAEDCARTQLP